MVDREKVLLVVLLALLIYPNNNFGGALQPEFLAPITNLTVPLGRDAIFTCLVEHLGGYRVGWVKADTKAIQAIHDHVITHNPRVSVSHDDHSTWSLHIKGVQLEDAGLYMCQINTDPMKSQTGVLSIKIPPDFIQEDTSGDTMVREGGQIKLTCRARGIPDPRVTWRREDGRDIVLREAFVGNTQNQKTRTISVGQYLGEVLKLTKISRSDMGAYMCIASNGVPPSISKRITINVYFPPVIQVPNQLVGAPLGTDVELECFVEASPKSINYWIKDNGGMIIQSARHDVQVLIKSAFEVRMVLTIRNLQKEDIGSYSCAAKNSLGEMESNIRLYEIFGPTKTQTWPPFYDEEEEIVYESAEMEKMENKPFSVDNTVHGHVGHSLASSPQPIIKIIRKQSTYGTSSSSSNSNFCQRDVVLIVVISICFRRR